MCILFLIQIWKITSSAASLAYASIVWQRKNMSGYFHETWATDGNLICPLAGIHRSVLSIVLFLPPPTSSLTIWYTWTFHYNEVRRFTTTTTRGQCYHVHVYRSSHLCTQHLRIHLRITYITLSSIACIYYSGQKERVNELLGFLNQRTRGTAHTYKHQQTENEKERKDRVIYTRQ